MRRANEKWYQHAEEVVMRYPEYCRDMERLEKDAAWKSREDQPGKGSKRPDPTAASGTLLADDPYYAQVRAYKDAVYGAYAESLSLSEGTKIVKIIRLLYWDRTHTLLGAAGAVGYSLSQAGRLRRRFIVSVAERLNWCKTI